MPTDQADVLFSEILAWSKGFALSDGADRLNARHFVLGAMKVRGGRKILSGILNSDLPLNDDWTPENLTADITKGTTPISDRSFELSPDIKKIIDDLWAREGNLRAEPMLTRLMAGVLVEKWGQEILAEVRKHPRIENRRTADTIKEILNEVAALRKYLAESIIGQDRALEQVGDAWFRVLLREKSAGGAMAGGIAGPKAVFTFLGPPGVGKTLTAKKIAAFRESAGKPVAFLRLDMSEYSTQQAHEQLIGTAKFYSGAKAGILSSFVATSPDAFILVDEVEKAHSNAQNLFLQILDEGRLYDNNKEVSVDFSRCTLVFTTNLGTDIYDSPHKSGFLSSSGDLPSVVLESLARESRSGGEGGVGFSPALLSRFSKSEVVLFNRLDGLGLERMADLAIRRFSGMLEASLGIRLDLPDPSVLSLLALRFGRSGDARRFEAALEAFLHGVVGDLVGDHRARLIGGGDPLAGRLRGLRFLMPDLSHLPESIRIKLGAPTNFVVVDDDGWGAVPPDVHIAGRFKSTDEVDGHLRKITDAVVLLDLHIGAASEQDGQSEKGLEILRWIRFRFPDVPVFLFSESPERRGLSLEMLQRVRLEGGAAGVLQKFPEKGESCPEDREPFFRQLREIDSAHRRQRLFDGYARHAKALDFDVTPRFGALGDDGFLPMEIGQIRETTAVSAADRNGIGWVDLPTDRLSDVAGAEHAKKRLEEVVRWFANPGPIREMGVEMPRGVLLTGPPGTGKTTLARAVAGEAQVPFFALSGSSVITKWAGESEKNIRELFARARRYAPSVIFFDEIDSIGGKRDGGGGESSKFSAGVLNELLAQMDGFSKGDRPVFVLAATNRVDTLDPALLRPGRFDLQIEVPMPGAEARKAIFGLHLKGKPVAPDVDLEQVIARTGGMSGADIKQVCVEACYMALRREPPIKVTMADLQEAATTVRLGLAAERIVLSESCRWSTAVHEAGHALAQRLLFPDEPIVQVTILPRGKALGFAEHSSSELHRDEDLARLGGFVQVLLAGRSAEEILLGAEKRTVGCSNDLERASSIALRVVSEWGLDSEFGLLSLSGVRDALGGGRERGLSPKIEDEAFSRARSWIADRKKESDDLLTGKKATLDALAKELLARETLYQDDLVEFFNSRGGAI